MKEESKEKESDQVPNEIRNSKKFEMNVDKRV